MTLLTLLLACTVSAAPTAAPAPDPGTWRWPLGPPAPEVVRPFSPPATPWGPGHRGVDLAAAAGRPVYAAASGRVSYAGRVAGRGTIAITHGALRTTYLPVRPAVRKGHDVSAGSRIGTVEPSAHCPAPCLHWGLLKGRTYLDPLSMVRPRVRLLPHWAAPEPSPPASPALRISLRDATTASGGALAGMMFAFTLASLWRHGRSRRPPPPGVVDLARERRLRRAR
ncbi:M23 family metallopeptidase [Spirillospora sp. NPDC029432]|uniref:M23 family metallopeptidase n=1 Tax=Spirillospora sp. NPDC029432 TaxID=3154599 RepID=UPI00345126A5